MKSPIAPSFSRSGGSSTLAVRITCGDPLWGARGLKMDRAIPEASYTSREPGPELLPSLGIASPLDQSSARCLGPRQTGWKAGTAGISRWVALQLLRPQRVCNQQSCGIWDLSPPLAPGRSAVLRMLLAAHRWQWAFTVRQRDPKFTSEPGVCGHPPDSPVWGARVWLSGSSSAEGCASHSSLKCCNIICVTVA